MKQYTEADYTDWFPGHIKPVRDGVYQRNYGSSFSRGLLCKFSKGVWYCLGNTADEAASMTDESDYQHEPWRGLKREPK